MPFNPDNNYIKFNKFIVYDSDISDNSTCSIEKDNFGNESLLTCEKIYGRLVDSSSPKTPLFPIISIDSPTTMESELGYKWERVGNYFVQVQQSISTGKIMIGAEIGADILRQEIKDASVI